MRNVDGEDGRWEKKLREEEAHEDGLNNQIQNTRTDTDADTSTKYNKIQRCERRYRRGEGDGEGGEREGAGSDLKDGDKVPKIAARC